MVQKHKSLSFLTFFMFAQYTTLHSNYLPHILYTFTVKKKNSFSKSEYNNALGKERSKLSGTCYSVPLITTWIITMHSVQHSINTILVFNIILLLVSLLGWLYICQQMMEKRILTLDSFKAGEDVANPQLLPLFAHRSCSVIAALWF